jgi:hypothetical protein
MSDSEVTVSACDLIVNLKETSTKLIGSVNYKTGTFDNDVIASMIERFYKVLQKIAVDVEKHISMFADDLGA